MSQLRILFFIILFGIMTGAGFLYGQSYSVYNLGITGDNADLRSDNNNNLHIMWAAYDYSRKAYALYYARIVNNAITGMETVGYGMITQYCRPRMSVRPDGGSVHTIWTDGDRHNLYHAWRDSNGWHTETVWGYESNLHWYWEAGAVDSSETVHIICGRVGSSGSSYLYYTRKPNGGSWSSPVAVTPVADSSDYVDTFMVNDPYNGGIHARWGNFSRLLHSRYCASGGNLANSPSSYIQAMDDVQSQGMGDIFVEKNGNVHLAINAYTYSGWVTVNHTFKPVGGTSFTYPTQASLGNIYSNGNDSYEIYPTVGVGSDNKIYVAWSQGKPPHTPNLVKLSVFDNGQWNLYTLDSAAGMTSDSIKCTIAVVSNAVYGIWRTGDKTWVLGKIPTPSLTLSAPNGGENWTVGSSYDITWSSTATIANVNIDYSTNSGSNWTSVAVGTANDGTYSWTVPGTPSTTCLVRVSDASNASVNDVSNSVFSISSPVAETISTPSQPSGAASGLKESRYSFSTGGSISNLGHTVQYRFDWDDGSDSAWLAQGTTGASHSWTANGTYDVRAMARCVTHTGVESLWSDSHAIIISDSGTSGKYNSPSQYKILPEVIWAPAASSGTWMSEVQITDISGGSQISVYYSTAAGRHGPFVLWNNSSGGALRSQKYSNMLQTIDGLDSGAFTYYGTVGAMELFTQDAAHVLQVTARTLNGNYSKTFPGLSLHDANNADTSRGMIIPNFTNNSAYRSTCGMFNPSADAVTVELRLLDAVNTQIGSTITKTLSGYGFSAFSPFSEAGRPYPAYSYDNVIVSVQPTSGSGQVFCFGASVNNATNDPAAHLAVQNGDDYDNGPGSLQILPEAIWATATGGGTWMSEAQIVDVTGGSTVSVYFDYGGGNRRGPFALWTGSGAGAKVKYANILQQLGTIDSGFTYYGSVGALEFQTQDNAHNIQVTARTLNGNCSKTFPGLNLVDAETADTRRIMLIQNYSNNSAYRSTCGFFNPTDNTVTVEFTLLNGSGSQIGAKFSKTFVGWDYQAFSPFNEAGVPYPANAYENVILRVRPTSGTGQVVCFGASANNASNDPASHLAMQGQ